MFKNLTNNLLTNLFMFKNLIFKNIIKILISPSEKGTNRYYFTKKKKLLG